MAQKASGLVYAASCGDPSGSGLLGCGANKVKGMARPSNVIEVKAEGGQGEHSAPYPRALVEFFIKAFTDPGDVVFDPFLGSASTMVAAMDLKRSCFGMEISPGYCDVAVQRAQAFANKPFLLAGCGTTFEQVKLSRRFGPGGRDQRGAGGDAGEAQVRAERFR